MKEFYPEAKETPLGFPKPPSLVMRLRIKLAELLVGKQKRENTGRGLADYWANQGKK